MSFIDRSLPPGDRDDAPALTDPGPAAPLAASPPESPGGNPEGAPPDALTRELAAFARTLERGRMLALQLEMARQRGDDHAACALGAELVRAMAPNPRLQARTIAALVGEKQKEVERC